VLVDVMLAVDGHYWRTRRELPALPAARTVLRLIDDPQLDATVTGSTCPPAGGDDRTAAGAILVRGSTTPPHLGSSAGLRDTG